MKFNTAFIAFLSLFFFTKTANAQKGSWYIGGQAGIGGTKSKQSDNVSSQVSKNFGWSLSPEIGTFITDKIQVGLAVTAGENKLPYSSFSSNPLKTTNYGAKIYGRRFWGKEQFKPFAGIQGSFIKSTYNGASPVTGVKSWNNNTTVVLNLGFSYALSSRVFVLGEFGTFTFNHSVSNSDPNPDNYRVTSNSFGFDAGTTGNRFNIGFYYTFKK